ncbi:MAG: hypothetical protein R6W90_13775 [Ignavibacteriaceae bacterium]
MSKGCFVKFIIILTIVVAAGLYIVQTKFDDWVISPGKKLVKIAFNESWDEKLDFVRPSPQKDSLRVMIEAYIDNIDPDSIQDEKIDMITNAVETVASDSIIDEHDLQTLNNLLRVNK